MTSLENLIAFYNSAGYDGTIHTVLKHCLLHLSSMENMTIEQLAEVCYTSTSTISRIVRELGYSNYSAFRQDIKSSMERYFYDNRIIQPQLVSNYSAMNSSDDIVTEQKAFISSLEFLSRQVSSLTDSEEIAEMAAAMHESKEVFIFPYGYHVGFESMLQSDLFVSGIPCDIVLGDSAQLDAVKKLGDGSLLLMLFPGAPSGVALTKKLLQTARSLKASTCLILLDSRTGLEKDADHSIIFTGITHNAVDNMAIWSITAMLTLQYRHDYLD